MKKTKQMITCMLLLIATTSCEKAFINGDLDGMWRLNTAEYMSESHPVGNIYYSFQRHLIYLQYVDEDKITTQNPTDFIGNLTYQGDEIIVKGFCHREEEEKMATTDELRTFYLFSDSTHFAILKLDDETMTLQSDSAILYFRKW